MAGLVPAIHVFAQTKEDVDARDKRGHDGLLGYNLISPRLTLSPSRASTDLGARPVASTSTV